MLNLTVCDGLTLPLYLLYQTEQKLLHFALKTGLTAFWKLRLVVKIHLPEVPRIQRHNLLLINAL